MVGISTWWRQFFLSKGRVVMMVQLEVRQSLGLGVSWIPTFRKRVVR